jgi:ribosomal protein S18 acetylase RimI-like enzyme
MNRDDLQLNIRRSDPSDFPVLHDFMREVDRIESLRGNRNPGQFITDQTTVLLESCESFLAIVQSEIIGAASVLVQSLPDAKGELNERLGHIYLIAVKENWRNQGIGGRLLQSALSWLKDEKISEITLTVKTANDGAVRFYRSYGFDPVALTMHHRIDVVS